MTTAAARDNAPLHRIHSTYLFTKFSWTMDCYSTKNYTKIITNINIFNKNCVCRCCFDKNTELKPIFNSIGCISQAIFLFTAVKIEEDDNLPKTICTTCINHLNKCINFKQKVESTNFLLRKLLADYSQKEGPEGFYDQLRDHDYAKPIESSLHAEMDSCSELLFDEGYTEETSSSFSLTKNSSKISRKNLFTCVQCGKKFADKTTLNNHEICHLQNNLSALNTTKPLFICSTCNENFTIEEDLFVHSSLHDNSKGFICKSCNKKFLTYFKLKRHLPSHFQEKPFKCQICEMRFVEMASLTRHFRVHTGAKPKSMHFCLVCKKTFPNRYSLKVHNRSHTGEQPWKCDSCDKKFTDFRLLNSHKRLHNENKPFECKECKKSFRHRSTLLTHFRTHNSSSIRPNRCNKCKKSFKQSWRLELHKRLTHATIIDSSRFLCNQCCQIFTSRASLEDHLRWHSNKVEIDTDNEPREAPPEFFQCNECSAQFSSPLDLITHQKLTHALRHECDTCFGKWKTLEELVRHKCNEALKASDEPSPDEMILLPNGQIQDCNTIVDNLLASVLERSAATTSTNEKETSKSA